MFRRKLMINLAIVLVCTAVALTIPVIIKNQPKANYSANNDNATSTMSYQLVSKFVGDEYAHTDNNLVWQVYQVQNGLIVNDWQAIYQALNQHNQLIYDTTNLSLTPYGLRFRNLDTAEDYANLYANGYSSIVTYQGRTCIIKLNISATVN